MPSSIMWRNPSFIRYVVNQAADDMNLMFENAKQYNVEESILYQVMIGILGLFRNECIFCWFIGNELVCGINKSCES